MTSIEFNFNIMSLLGNTDQEASVSSQGEEEGNEQHLHSQQSTLVQNDSITDSVVGSDTASTTTAFVRRTIGVSDDATRTAESARRIRDSSSGTSLGSRYDLESRGFSSTEAAHPSSSSALLNDGSFEIENYENLTEDLGLNPLIDVNEPTPQVPPSKNLEDNNQGTTHDEDMDKKPAAVDSTIFQQQQQRSSSIQNALSFDQTITGEKGGEGRKITPVASVVRGSDRSSEQEGKSDLKPPPVPSLTRGNRRSSRIHTQKKAVPKRARPSVGKFSRARPTIGTESNMKTSASKKRKSTKVAGPSKKQLKEARTPRKIEALQTWFKRLQELVDFKDANGHANVPQQYTKNHSLGIWVNKQRMEKKAKDTGKPSSLTDEKVQLLEEAGFVWAKRKGQVAWEEKFVELQTFLLRNGHCNVPTKNKTNRALGRWVSTQRANYKRFVQGESPKHPRMDREELERRIRRLNGIGFAWSLLPGTAKPEEEVERSDNDEEEEEEEQNSVSEEEGVENDEEERWSEQEDKRITDI